MKRYIVRKIIAETPEEAAPAKNILINSGKLLGILLSAVMLTQALFSAGMSSESLLMIYFLAVLMISFITPKYSYGILAAVIASFAFDYFITEPYFGFSFSVRYPITLFTMLVATFLTSTLTMLLKHQADIAHRREQRAEFLSEINQELMGARNISAIADITIEYLSAYLDCPAILFVADPKSTSPELCAPVCDANSDVFFAPEELARVHRVFATGSSDVLETEEAVFYFPVSLRETVLGVIGLARAGKKLNSMCVDLVNILIRQVAHALELQRMSDEQNNLRISAEKEKMRSTLLRSISHDLRTPLTSIQGASAAILDQRDMPEKMRDSLLHDIRENAKWLIRMVENILTVTRISQETLKLHKTLEAAEEIMSQSVSIVRGRFPDCHIHVKIPDELIMVPMDATLISQVIINLLENAVRNSENGALVLLTLKKKDKFALFEVSDHGTGISEDLLDNLFEIHIQSDDYSIDSSRGIGIGLSICHTIIQAHGGTIEGHNREEGGAKFSFLLPLEKPPADKPGEEEADE